MRVSCTKLISCNYQSCFSNAAWSISKENVAGWISDLAVLIKEKLNATLTLYLLYAAKKKFASEQPYWVEIQLYGGI